MRCIGIKREALIERRNERQTDNDKAGRDQRNFIHIAVKSKSECNTSASSTRSYNSLIPGSGFAKY